MHTHSDKAQESKAPANTPHASSINVDNEASPQFVDNRPEATVQRKLKDMALSHTAHQLPLQKKENNTGLPDTLKTGIESLSGYSMDDVKVHYNSNKPAQLQAHAYAQGTQIHLGAGQEKHLPHEAWHVVQQKQGKVKPTLQKKGNIAINDDKGLEKEADIMGAKAVQMKHNYLGLGSNSQNKQSKPNALSSLALQRAAIIQRVPKFRENDVVLVKIDDILSHGLILDLDQEVKEYMVRLVFQGSGGKMVTLKYDDNDELSFKGVPIQIDSYEKTKADVQHDLVVAQNTIYDLIKGGATIKPTSPRELLWRNSCEWLLSDTGVKLTVVVPTNDMMSRSKEWRKEPSYFDFSTIFPSMGGDYVEGAEDKRVQFIEIDTVAYLQRADAQMVIPFIAERYSEEDMKSTLIHETQHHADKHLEKDRWSDKLDKQGKKTIKKEAKAAPEVLQEAMNSFTSEFRAYFVERLFTGELKADMFVPEQLEGLIEQLMSGIGREIKVHIAHQYPYSKALLDVPYYKQIIKDLIIPTGGNLLNSIRIEQLVIAVNTHLKKTFKSKTYLSNWESIIVKMDPLEIQFLLHKKFCPQFWHSMSYKKRSAGDEVEMLLKKHLKY